MSNLPRNKWISYGLRFFIYFLLVVVVSFAFVDLPTGQLGEWGRIGLTVIQAVAILLPVLSFTFCLYGLLKLDKSKESGSPEAVIVIILLGVFGIYAAYNYLT